MSINIRSCILFSIFSFQRQKFCVKISMAWAEMCFYLQPQIKPHIVAWKKTAFSEIKTIRVPLLLDENVKYLSDAILSLLREVLLVPDPSSP